MDDGKIIDLFWASSETALNETANKYSWYCFRISLFTPSAQNDIRQFAMFGKFSVLIG